MGGQNPPLRCPIEGAEVAERPLTQNADDHYVWSRVIESGAWYSYLEVLGRVPTLVIPLQKQRNARNRQDDVLFITLPHDLQEQLRQYAGEFYCGEADVKSYDVSVRKMDVAPVKKYKHTEIWRQAKSFVWGVYGPLFEYETRMVPPEELVPQYSLDTSSGVPMQQAGLKKKRDVLRSEYGRKYMTDFGMNYIPVWRVSGKREWLHKDDLDAHKVRTFIVPPFKFLHQQKTFFHSQNVAMKNFHWSAYGFNPYQGGTNEIAQRLLVNNVFVMYDVKGWDRKVPNMRTVYKLRTKFHKGNAQKAAKLVGDLTCRTVLVLCDGTLVCRKNGNNSGSGSTTNDNILCHTFILAYVLFKLYEGREQLVRRVVAFLFGDDDALSLPDTGKTNEEIETTFREGFLDFGLELDPFLVTRDLSQIEFLGFYFTKVGSTWLPRYKIDRLLAAFCYEIDKSVTHDKSISKAYALMVMAYPHGGEKYNLMRRAYKLYLRTLHDSEDSVVRSYVLAGVPSNEAISDFYTGRETGGIARLFRTEGLEVYNISGHGNEQSY